MIKLGVNIDHIATLRNARGELFPSVIEAALIAETYGADIITVHLREDRRHIKDNDIILLRQVIKTKLNLEIATTEEMLHIACDIKPDFVCLVPEKREELTTEGGLNVIDNFKQISNIINVLHQHDIKVSVFIDGDKKQIDAAKKAQTDAIEIHTGKYANIKDDILIQQEIRHLYNITEYANSCGLIVNAGHGLNYHNVTHIAKLPHINDLNIGFAIIAKSIFCGLHHAVAEMKTLINT